MRLARILVCLIALTLAPSRCLAVLVVSADEQSAGTFSVSVTTDVTFDTIEVLISGDVANGQNIVPISGVTSSRQLVSFTPAFTLLAPLGSPLTEGVFDPALNVSADIDLTYGVTNPTGAQWTDGLADVPFLAFDLLSGVADVTVNLLSGGPVVSTSTVQASSVAAVPEAGAVLCWTLITSAATLGGYRRRRVSTRRGRSATPRNSARARSEWKSAT